ncbi:hypothetical protein OAP63_00690 [Vibrio sp.]|nr:hypothetical protein [Vibrio sp.]
MTSAYASTNQMGEQLKADGKGNKISSFPEQLQMLKIQGNLVIIDAMACLTKIEKAIIQQGWQLSIDGKSQSRMIVQSGTERLLEHTGKLP